MTSGNWGFPAKAEVSEVLYPPHCPLEMFTLIFRKKRARCFLTNLWPFRSRGSTRCCRPNRWPRFHCRTSPCPWRRGTPKSWSLCCADTIVSSPNEISRSSRTNRSLRLTRAPTITAARPPRLPRPTKLKVTNYLSKLWRNWWEIKSERRKGMHFATSFK